MRIHFPHLLVLSTVLSLPLLFSACETSHTETTRENLLGGTTHKETTTTENPITGDVTTEKQTEVTH